MYPPRAQSYDRPHSHQVSREAPGRPSMPQEAMGARARRNLRGIVAPGSAGHAHFANYRGPGGADAVYITRDPSFRGSDAA